MKGWSGDMITGDRLPDAARPARLCAPRRAGATVFKFSAVLMAL